MNMSILAIIPARGGSKGLPGKNIRMLKGKPLIAHTIIEAKKSKYINHVIVSTDDLEIANIAKSFDARVPFIRPEYLATDQAKAPDVAIHSLNWFYEEYGQLPEITVLLQCTSPLRTVQDIDGAILKFKSKECDSLTSVCKTEHSPMWMFKIEKDILIPIMEDFSKYSQRQMIPNFYRQNGAIYIARSVDIMRYHALEFGKLIGYEMSQNDSVDIDTELDFKIAEILMGERNQYE